MYKTQVVQVAFLGADNDAHQLTKYDFNFGVVRAHVALGKIQQQLVEPRFELPDFLKGVKSSLFCNLLIFSLELYFYIYFQSFKFSPTIECLYLSIFGEFVDW